MTKVPSEARVPSEALSPVCGVKYSKVLGILLARVPTKGAFIGNR